MSHWYDSTHSMYGGKIGIETRNLTNGIEVAMLLIANLDLP